MYNSETPLRAELPSSAQLIRSTLVAAVTAAVLLVTVVLPAEYAIDPTGIGRLLGMTPMGEIKQQLAAEAAADAARTATPLATPGVAASSVAAATADIQAPQASAPTPAAPPAWRDEQRYVLKPGQGIEVKLRMNEGETAQFAWSVTDGELNYDTHGDGGGRSISYIKGRGVAKDEGELKAVFTGNHGWFFRNRGRYEVTLILRTRGQYQEIKRVL